MESDTPIRPLTVALFDELTPLYPDTPLEYGMASYTVAAATGTYAGVHLLVSGLRVGQAVTIEAGGPHQRYRFSQMIPVPVECNAGAHERSEALDGEPNPHVIRRAPFMIYEVLQPVRNVVRADADTMAFVFRCVVQGDAEDFETATTDSATYDSEAEHPIHEWTIEVSHLGESVRRSFRVETFPTEVPPATPDDHRYVNWIFLDEIAANHHVEMWSPRWEQLVVAYLKLAHYGRQNVLCLWPTFYFDVDESGSPVFREAKLSTLIRLAREAGIDRFQGGTFAGRKDGEWEASEAELAVGGAPIPGEGEAVLRRMAREVYAYLKANELTERWVQSFFDEPLDVSSEVYRVGTDILHQAMPGIPILEATKARETIVGTVDIWCPTVNEYERNRDFFDARIAAGDRVWVYTCLEPAGAYCNRLLDMERLRPVWLGWAAAIYPVDGFLHWGGNYTSGRNVYRTSVLLTGETTDFTMSIPHKTQLPAGDNCIIYPGDEGPRSSTRLEAQRIGQEDLKVYREAAQRDRAEAGRIVASVFRGYADYETTIQRYRQAKRRLLALASANRHTPDAR